MVATNAAGAFHGVHICHWVKYERARLEGTFRDELWRQFTIWPQIISLIHKSRVYKSSISRVSGYMVIMYTLYSYMWVSIPYSGKFSRNKFSRFSRTNCNKINVRATWIHYRDPSNYLLNALLSQCHPQFLGTIRFTVQGRSPKRD